MAKFTLTSDVTLNYHMIDGDPDKPVLVFLHEGLGCIAMWKSFPEKLCAATGCAGLIYDRCGYGQSSALQKPRSIHYIHEYAIIELPALLDHVLADRPYIVVGHSDGGSIALIHAASQRPGLQGVITEAAHIFIEDITLAGIRVADAAWEQGKLKGLHKYHGDKTAQTFKAWSATWLTPAFAHWNIEYLLPAITAPCCIIQGVDDQYGSADQVDRIVAQVSGSATGHMLPDCAHSPHLEAEQATLAVMQEFIRNSVT